MIFKAFIKMIMGILFFPFILSANVEPKQTNYSRLEIGPEYSDVKLHVSSTPLTTDLNFRGKLWGIVGAYEYKIPQGIYLNLNGAYRKNPIVGNHDNRQFVEQNIEGRVGYQFAFGCSKQWKFIPYTGFGWNRITQSKVGLLSMKVKAPTYYVPIGLLAIYTINEQFQMGANLKYLPQVDASVQISTIKHGRWNIKNKDAFTIDLPFNYHYNCPVDGTITFIPFWRILRKGEGTAVNGLQNIKIAEQVYHFWGARLIFGINF